MLEILNEEAEQNPENPIIIMHGNNIEKAYGKKDIATKISERIQ